MSYRHPRFYREDFTGFNNAMQKSFGEQFKNVTDYFDKKIEARKEYEADLHAQADTTGTGCEGLVARILNQAQ